MTLVGDVIIVRFLTSTSSHSVAAFSLSVSRASDIHAVRSSNMSSIIPPVSLERIDHGVLPSNDLGRAFRFWSSFMGARLGFHANLNVRGLNREVPMIVFFTVANHPGVWSRAGRISLVADPRSSHGRSRLGFRGRRQ